MNQPSLAERDQKVVWHPYTYLKEFPGAIAVERTEAEFLLTSDGRRLLDAVSSWWVNVHGHSHPHLIASLIKSLGEYDQIIFADLTHEAAVNLAERILEKFPAKNLAKVFFSDNGSTAVEAALKLAIQATGLRASTGSQKNANKKQTILALEGSYHGDTFGAMAASARSIFTGAFADYLFAVQFIPIHSDPDGALGFLEKVLAEQSVIALIYEPLLQGAGGMLMSSKPLLDQILARLKDAGVYLIADEVLTGFGRTGTMFASEQLGSEPDLVCLSKGLTGGVLPLGLTLISEAIHQLFLAADFKDSFFHGHSYTANPWACHVANASLDLFEERKTWDQIEAISAFFTKLATEIQGFSQATNIRTLGPIFAFDLQVMASDSPDYSNPLKRLIAGYFLEQGIYMRPLGNTIYFMPPYCMTEASLELLRRATLNFLRDQPWKH